MEGTWGKQISRLKHTLQAEGNLSAQLLPVTERVNFTLKLKGKKGKVVPVLLTKHHAMKAYWGSGCIAPLIL
jgi:hypothetical protein